MVTRMKGSVRYFDLLIPITFATALCCLAPLRTAFELNVCEGWEMMKGFLFSLGYAPSKEMWNDQPPLHTFFLGILFRILGPTAYVARLLQVAFATLLVWSLYKVVQKQIGRFGAF